MSWTKKHDEFCLKQKLRPSSCVLLRNILRKANSHEVCEIEIDLRVENQWVKKSRGRGYDRKTLKFALAQLDGCTDGLVLISKSYTWAIHKIIVRPLSFVLSQNSQNKVKTPKLPTGEPMFDKARFMYETTCGQALCYIKAAAERKKTAYKQQQQNISKLDTILRKVGLSYDRHALNRLWKFSGRKIDNIASAIELLLHRHSTQSEKIKNPQGWLIDCLKFGWSEGFNLYYQAELPFFSTGNEISCFVSDAMGKPPHPA